MFVEHDNPRTQGRKSQAGADKLCYKGPRQQQFGCRRPRDSVCNSPRVSLTKTNSFCRFHTVKRKSRPQLPGHIKKGKKNGGGLTLAHQLQCANPRACEKDSRTDAVSAKLYEMMGMRPGAWGADGGEAPPSEKGWNGAPIIHSAFEHRALKAC